MIGVKVKINPRISVPTPFGLEYEAKGFYMQGKNIIVVGRLEPENTIRIKYPKDWVMIEIIDDDLSKTCFTCKWTSYPYSVGESKEKPCKKCKDFKLWEKYETKY